VFKMIGLTGDLLQTVLGSRLKLKEGADAQQGIVTVGPFGSVVVPNAGITANTRIALTYQEGVAAVNAAQVTARTPGTSFTITATPSAEVFWQLWEPAP
jgi:hypothetical protein